MSATRGQKAGGYRLANCVALLGAVVADDRTQLPRISELMRQALTADKYLDSTGGRTRRSAPAWKALADEVKAERRSAAAQLLEFAKAKTRAGLAWRGVSKDPAKVEPVRPFSRRGKRWQPGVVRGWVLEVLGDTSKSAQDIAEVIGLHQNSIARHLKMLVLSGQVRPVGQRVGAIGRAATLYRKEAA